MRRLATRKVNMRMTSEQLRALGYDETGKKVEPIAVGGIGIRLDKPQQESSPLEERFITLWTQLKLPPLEREYRFFAGRRWRFDFAHVLAQVAIEVEGGVWSGGRHTRGMGFISDCEKYNEATLLGWHVFRLPDELICGEWLCKIGEFIIERIVR